MRRTTQERIVADAVQLGVGGGFGFRFLLHGHKTYTVVLRGGLLGLLCCLLFVQFGLGSGF